VSPNDPKRDKNKTVQAYRPYELYKTATYPERPKSINDGEASCNSKQLTALTPTID